MYKVEGATVVAVWTFAAKDAPPKFTVVVVEADGLPVALAEPVRVERAEVDGGVTFTATIALRSPATRSLELRPTAGDVVTVPPQETGAPISRAPAPPAAGMAEAVALRNVLDQQPDRGAALLRVLMPSADPAVLRAQIDATATTETLRAIWPFERLFAPKIDEKLLDEFCNAYNLPPISAAQATSQAFQTKEDWKNYAFAPGAIGFTLGDEVLSPVWRQLADPVAQMTHDVRPGEFSQSKSIEVGLFSDNGNGLHASKAIARQIVDSRLPYAFHLGDVYYGGSQQEFQDYFEKPLRPMFDRTELFMITGNHEMFAKGRWYQAMVAEKAASFPGRQRQRGEMFRLRGPGFKILGIDTMFVGWNARQNRIHDYADAEVVKVLDAWLADRPDDLTILMTTNEPWDLGTTELRPLYESMRATIAGRVDLWFYGNVHYAALFEPWGFPDLGSRSRRVVASCIGHGGYPFYTRSSIGPLPQGVRCRWLETKSRFWPHETLRPDVGANGWCRLKLTRSGTRWDVGLTFVDWVGRERLRAALVREDGGTIRFGQVTESDAAGVGAPMTWNDRPER